MVIKKLIFDLDNTIIEWIPEYVEALKETLNEYKIDIDYKKIDNIIEMQEKIHDTLSREQLLSDINNGCNLNLNIDFINTLIDKQKKLTPYNDEKLKKLFEYLSSKYEIVLLTNWFKECQIGRLKNLGVYKYFKAFYCGDEMLVKPNKEAFIKAIGKCKPNECIMIGDNKKIDIDGALKLGINAIMITKGNINTDNKFKIIKNIYELKEML